MIVLCALVCFGILDGELIYFLNVICGNSLKPGLKVNSFREDSCLLLHGA